MRGLVARSGAASPTVAEAAVPRPEGNAAAAPTRRRHGSRRALVALVVAAGLAWGTGFDYVPLPQVSPAPSGTSANDRAGLASERRRLASALLARTPPGAYVVIDQTHNRLRLMRGGRVELETPCSAGTGMVLKEGRGGRTWVFDTPRGAFRVLSKLRNPVWRKPDWAFVEEGLPIPADPRERLEYGSLGEYAFYLGNGYLIHGTLYERLIGRPASHGCIRVGREPLRVLYRDLPVGAHVYIY